MTTNFKHIAFAAAMVAGTVLIADPASAQLAVVDDSGMGATTGFSQIFARITNSFGGLPGLISMFAYLLGIIFAIAGILKIKDHVENPGNTDLKAGAIRLIVGGALFALPFVMGVMTSTVGDQTQQVTPITLKKAGYVKAP